MSSSPTPSPAPAPSSPRSPSAGVLDELAGAIRTVADRVGPAVVRIGRGGGRGCGVVVAPGQVLTNAHNVRAAQATVTFADGRRVLADVAGADLDGDLAVLRVDTGDIAPVAWATTPAELGDVVVVVGRGAGGGTRATWGSVSATERPFRGPRGRRIEGSLEHTAPLPARSSGTPVLDVEGRLVGLDTSRVGDGFYLAIPADDALRQRVEALASGTVPPPRQLGVALAPPHVARKLRRSVGLPERDGLLVRAVEPELPGGRAGLAQGDLLVRADDRELTSVDDLYAALDEAGETLDLVVVRGVDEVHVRVSFAGGADTEGEA